ncbi:Highly reducing polyketide synthase gloL [Cladobotryum mycophilum]|uniref:Highly reducing polyketide synthase gloL n=1 Tax=Cladobotryum mycophilum TaxID=491253 RepID=A0ABR0S5S6_9HYPO
MSALLKEAKHDTTFLEVGPHSALQGPINQILKDRASKHKHSYVPTLIRNKDCVKSILIALGELFARGHAVDFSYVNPTTPVLTDLPNYPWDHSVEYWSESRLASEWRFRKHTHHELLGSSVQETSSLKPVWRNLLNLNNVPWLRDHKLMNDIVFPCAGYIAMMGQAIKQVCGSESYRLQNLMVKSTLVLAEGESVEIITTMRPSRLTDLTNSSWYDLVISTYNGSTWTENCIAQGKAAEDGSLQETPIPVPQPRRISTKYLYERVSSIGLKYGPCFQRLGEVTAHTKELKAVAVITDDESEHASRYAVHPTTLDLCLQLCLVARTRGIIRDWNLLKVSYNIKDIEIHPCGPEIVAEASVLLDVATNLEWGSAVAVTREKKRVIKFSKVLGLSLDTGLEAERTDAIHAGRLNWRPDLDFLDADSLMRRSDNWRNHKLALERLATLCILDALDTLESSTIATSGYLTKLVQWLEIQKENMIQGKRQFVVPEAKQWALSDAKSRGPLLSAAADAVHSIGDHNTSGVADILCEITKSGNIQSIFGGKMSPVELLTEGDELERFYSLAHTIANQGDFFALCAHAQPSLRVLEIGAGTGATTKVVLPTLMSSHGLRMYAEYTVTDISSGFLAQAQERFKGWDGLQYKVLDIEKDPAEQGFQLESYDLVIASNVLHATSSLQQSLKNVKSLLRPGGRLYLQELIQPLTWYFVSFIMSFFPGWWIGENDDRVDSPLVSIDRWNKELQGAGFCGAESVFLDDEMFFHTNAVIVSRVVAPVVHAGAVTLLYKEKRHEFAHEIAAILEQRGTKVHWSEITNQEHIEGQDIISTIDLEAPFFHLMPEEDYKTFMNHLSKLNDGILWLTRSCQVNCTDPRYAVVLGLARTIRQEHSIGISTVELESLDSTAAGVVTKLFEKFHNRPRGVDKGRSIDHEFVVRDGTVHVGRFDWFPMSAELEMELQDDDPKRLTIGNIGSFDSIHWVHHERSLVQANEIEVNIRCVGLNFRDIMIAAGFVPGKDDCFGLEASGVVARTGSAVDNLMPGDHVLMLGNGLFTTRKVIPASHVVPIPKGLSLEDAAAMPVVYVTAIQALINLGNLQRGQTILIHSACGGVGQAAIHLSKMVGAEIYATVGNEDKVQHLLDHHNIPRERIFNSRTTAFVEDIMKATENRGVDLVLNSLSGELLHASWQCVAKYGKMMEIGKRDILERGHLGLDLFNGNRTFFGIDLDGLSHDRPDDVGRLMEQFVQYFTDGHAKPIRPVTFYPAQKVLDAFRFMKTGQHMGFLRELESQGCQAIPAVGSVSEMADVKRAIQMAPTRIAGVIQMSMVLRDTAILDMSYEDWTAVLAPKVTGTWNLHSALLEDVDFFILFSSLSGISGRPGQASYAAANTFLDAFAQYRQSLGRACSVIDIGFMEGIGVVSRHPAILSQYTQSGGYLLQEQQLIEAIQASIRRSRPSIKANPPGNSFTSMCQLSVGLRCSKPLHDPSNYSTLRWDIRAAMYWNFETQIKQNTDVPNTLLQEKLEALRANPSILDEPNTLEVMTWELGRIMCHFMLIPEESMEISMTLVSIGIDSIVSIEVRNWLRQVVGIETTVLQIMGAETIEGLGKLAIDLLKKKHMLQSSTGGEMNGDGVALGERPRRRLRHKACMMM